MTVIFKILKWFLLGVGALVLTPFLFAIGFIAMIALTAVWSFVFNMTIVMFIILAKMAGVG